MAERRGPRGPRGLRGHAGDRCMCSDKILNRRTCTRAWAAPAGGAAAGPGARRRWSSTRAAPGAPGRAPGAPARAPCRACARCAACACSWTRACRRRAPPSTWRCRPACCCCRAATCPRPRARRPSPTTTDYTCHTCHTSHTTHTTHRYSHIPTGAVPAPLCTRWDRSLCICNYFSIVIVEFVDIK